jgi:L-alanine-DL-glutamate epimerase-like enolase superfamily enzyme
MAEVRIRSIELARLEGKRPRHAGANARLGDHGPVARVPMARITTDDGAVGVGLSRGSREQAQDLVGQPLSAVFADAVGAQGPGLPFEFPLWDLVAKRAGVPVYALTAAANGRSIPAEHRVAAYDTTLLIDDLHLADDNAAAALIADEARAGWARGHRAFKIKVGRGARHMPLDAGTRRDVAVVRAVRAAVGPDARLMLDANNGYNLNLTKRVLAETASDKVFWMEEPFHEDPVLFRDLRDWIRAEGLATFIADGEGSAAPALLDWARDGLLDVIQYDIVNPGMTRWLPIARQLDGWGSRTAPHHYGTWFGNYAGCHLAPAAANFMMVEWEEASVPGFDGSDYRIEDGIVSVPASPGFGLRLDDTMFRDAVARDGFVAQ